MGDRAGESKRETTHSMRESLEPEAGKATGISGAGHTRLTLGEGLVSGGKMQSYSLERRACSTRAGRGSGLCRKRKRFSLQHRRCTWYMVRGYSYLHE